MQENYQLEHDAGRPNQRRPILPRDILADGEELLYESRPVLWPLLISPILFSIAGFFVLVMAGRFPVDSIDTLLGQASFGTVIQTVIRWIGIAMIVIGALGVMVRWLRWRFTVYAATNRRVLRQTGILDRCYVDCSISKIQTLHMRIPLPGRIFDFGTIKVATAGTASTEIQWEMISRPKYAHRKLTEIIEHYH